MLAALTLLPLAVAAATVGCSGHHIGRHNPGGQLVHRQVANSDTNPSDECKAYSYAPVEAIVSKYPTIWQPADLVQGDATAAALFNSINATVNARLPGVVPNGDGAHNGAWGSSFSYPSSDPNCWWTHAQCTTPASSTGLAADITTMPEPETWGYGFDDGPNCSHNALYNFLQEQKQRATMFYIGSNVMDWPLQAIRGFNDGHEICVHTWSHNYMTSFSNQQAFAELYYTQKAIKDVVGVTPKCWRPPYGDVDNRIRLIASLLNMTTIVWSDDTDDWAINTNGITNDTVVGNYDKVINNAKSGLYATHGPIVLNHELNNYTMETMVEQYGAIKAAFKYIVPIASGYNITQPYMETNVTYPDFNEYVGIPTTTSVSSTSSATASATASASSSAGVAGAAAATSSSAKHNSAPARSVGGVSVFGVLLGGVVALAL